MVVRLLVLPSSDPNDPNYLIDLSHLAIDIDIGVGRDMEKSLQIAIFIVSPRRFLVFI